MKRVYINLFAFLIFAGTSLSLSAQELDWAYSITNPANVREGTLGLSTNGKDKVVISGRGIEGLSLDFKNQSTDHESDHAFIAVYDKSGSIIWSTAAADPANFKQYTHNVHMNAKGEVFSFGRFSGKVDFDPGSGKDEVTADGAMYMQKFDASGNYQWVKVLPIFAFPSEIAEKPNGNILVAGKMNGDTSLTIAGKGAIKMSQGIFIVEFTPDGELVNAGSGYGSFNTIVRDLTTDRDGNIILCGGFDGIADFDLGANVQNDTANRAIDAYVAVYDKDLNLKWQKRYGDIEGNAPSWDYATGVVTGPDNAIYVVGRFTYKTDFDPKDQPGKFVFLADDGSQSPDGCILKYKPDGELEWVRQIGGNENYKGTNKDIEIWRLAIEDSSLYLGGNLTGVADFDPSPDTVIVHAEDFSTTMFVSQYDLDGWYKTSFLVDDTSNTLALSGVEEINGMVVFDGSLYAYGRFQKMVDFDPGAGEHILSTDVSGGGFAGDNDIYLAKYQFEEPTNSISQGTKELGYKIFPNPATDVLSIHRENGMPAVYALMDLSGRVIQSGILEGKNSHINLLSLRTGMYILKLNSGGDVRSARFVVSR